MTLKLLARRNRNQKASWQVFEGTMQIPSYSVTFYESGWFIKAMPGPYGVSEDQLELADWMEARIDAQMTLHEVLAEVRAVIEADHARARAEIEAERETERRAEAFWENRMSDEDKAREDEEYANDDYLAMREEERLAELAFIRNGYDRLD